MTTRYTARDGRVIRESGDAVEVLDPTDALLQALEMRAAAVVARAQADRLPAEIDFRAPGPTAFHPERLALSGAVMSRPLPPKTETRR